MPVAVKKLGNKGGYSSLMTKIRNNKGVIENQRVFFDRYVHKVFLHVISPRSLHKYERYSF